MSYDPYILQRIPVVPGPTAPHEPPTVVLGRRKPLVSPLIVVLAVAAVIGVVLGSAVAGEWATEPAVRRAAAAPEPVAVVFSTVSEQQWQLIAAAPDAYAGAAIVVYGTVTDAGSDPAAVRVFVGGKRRQSGTEAVLTGDELLIGSLADDDEFTAKVVVTGGPVVPRLEVRHIVVV